MTNEDEILIEQRITNLFMSKEERNFCINLILNSKDVNDSDIYINAHGLSKYEILFLHLVKIDGVIQFDGGVGNEYEQRYINGFIRKCKEESYVLYDNDNEETVSNKVVYYMRTNVYRCNDYIYGDDKEYSVTDYFNIKTNTKNGNVKQKAIRKSRYENTSFSETEVHLLDDDTMELYLEDFAKSLKRK